MKNKKRRIKENPFITKEDIDYWDYKFKFKDLNELVKFNGLKRIKISYFIWGVVIGMIFEAFTDILVKIARA